MVSDLDGKSFYVRRDTKTGSAGWQGLKIHENGDLAVIIRQTPLQNRTKRSSLVTCLGPLVKVTRTQKDNMVADHIRMVNINGKDSRFDSRPNLLVRRVLRSSLPS